MWSIHWQITNANVLKGNFLYPCTNLCTNGVLMGMSLYKYVLNSIGVRLCIQNVSERGCPCTHICMDGDVPLQMCTYGDVPV